MNRYQCGCCLTDIEHFCFLCDKCAKKYMEDPCLLILAYGTAYYNYGVSIVEDDIFDRLCDSTLKDWDNIDSVYKDYNLKRDMLETTSTYNAHYPRAAHSLYKYLTYNKEK